MKSIVRTLCEAAIFGTVVAIIMTASSALFGSTSLNHEDVFKFMDSRTVKLLDPTGRGGGTGFAVKAASGKTYTLTNAHVCKISKDPYMIAVRAGASTRLSILEISTDADLCILDAFPAAPGGLTLAHKTYRGEQLYLAGHPYLQPITVRAGLLAHQQLLSVNQCQYSLLWVSEKRMLNEIFGENCRTISYIANIASLDSYPGNSGSAVINAWGELVGVLFAGNSNGLSALVPLYDVQKFLSRY